MSKSPVEGATCGTCVFSEHNTGPGSFDYVCRLQLPIRIDVNDRVKFKGQWCSMHPSIYAAAMVTQHKLITSILDGLPATRALNLD